MITALDTSVILDVLTDDRTFAARSESSLRQARREGKLIICACVVSEILPALGDGERVRDLLADWQVEFVADTVDVALLAGEHFRLYLSRGGRGRVLPDFLIGAHAMLAADRLLARDRGYLRDSFSGLAVWDPAAAR